MNELTHLNDAGEANMVDVSAKSVTDRTAVAQAKVCLSAEVLQRVRDNTIAKGDLLAVARVAGIQAAKKCSELIPLCHPLPLTKASVDIEYFEEPDQQGLLITSLCKTSGQTGVEMEALTSASVAALTIYDMCKALDKGIVISETKLLSKSGGKSGDWLRNREEK